MQPLVSHSPGQLLLHQAVVKSRMNHFHSRMASLQVSTCVTCIEKFPGMTVRTTAAGTECVRCNRDKNRPKAYSCGNNMHPGPVPQELLVSIFVASLATSYLLLSSTGADPGGGDAYHVHIQTGSGTVWLHWTCGQPATGCGLLCPQSATTTVQPRCHNLEEGRSQPDPLRLSSQATSC